MAGGAEGGGAARDGKLAVAVYGAACAVGAELISQLGTDPEVEKVLGFDEQADADPHADKLTFRRLAPGGQIAEDLRRAGVKLAVYLSPFAAGAFAPAKGTDDLPSVRRFVEACEAAEVDGVVVVSGSSIYGARSENPQYFAEGAPLRPQGLVPGEADLARERLFSELARRRPSCAIAICRLAQVVGPGSRGLLSHLIGGPKLMVVAGYDPPVQFVHAVDVARIAFRLLKTKKVGVYNVAPDDYTTLLQIGRTFKKPLVRASPTMAQIRAWFGSFLGGLPPAFLPLLQYPILLSNKKLKRDTGYIFKYGTEQALADQAKHPERELQRV